MHRRSYLRTVGAGAIATATAGCLGGLFSSGAEGTVLSEPEDQLAESSSLAYPAYGEPFPDVTLPDPFREEPIRTGSIEKPFVCTAFYAFCPAECYLLLSSFANLQATLQEAGRLDDVKLLAITFDPERDTREELEAHADLIGVQHTHENWHYLRPTDEAEAKAVVEDELGLAFEKVEGGDAYDFNHLTITFLVNPDGVVERAYRGDRLDVERVSTDIESIVSAYE
ncbi:MAG: SCO family protein [Halobacteriota archaeon]